MAVRLSENQIKELESVKISTSKSIRLKEKASIILEYNISNNREGICIKHGISIRTIQRWINKYKKQGLDGLIDKEFKKTSYIKDNELNIVVKDFKINPIKYGLPYSIWDEFTVKQYLDKNLHCSIDSSQATVRKIINKCKSIYGYNFFDFNCENITFFENVVNEWLGQNYECLYCHCFYLGYRRKLVDSKEFLPRLSPINKCAYGLVVKTSGGDIYRNIIKSDDEFTLNDKYAFYDDIINTVVSSEKKYLILIDSSKSGRIAIQKLYLNGILPNNIQFLTIPTNIHKKLECLQFIYYLKSRIILGDNSYSRNVYKSTFDDDTKICFHNRCLQTMRKNFDLLLYTI